MHVDIELGRIIRIRRELSDSNLFVVPLLIC